MVILEPERQLEAFRTEGERLAGMPAELLDAPVPAVEGWTVERVVRHCTRIHWWVTDVLAAGPEVDSRSVNPDLPRAPKGPACLPAYREALEGLLAELGRHDFSEPASTFLGAGSVAFWARRMTNEVAVHRIDTADAVHAAGGPAPEPLDADVAADGVDEWARLFLATRLPQRDSPDLEGLEGATIGLRTNRTGPAGGVSAPVWVGSADPVDLLLSFRFGGTDVAERTSGERADATLQGDPQDLLLVLWRRRPLDNLEVTGDRLLAERLIDTTRI